MSEDKKTVNIDLLRRRLMKYSALTLGGVALEGMLGSQLAFAAEEEIRIGYWPIVGGLPLYVGVERGLFKQAGLNVKAVKFASAQQVVESMITGRIHGCANGTATGALGLGEITSPNLFKIICANPSNEKMVLDEFLVPLNSTVQSIAELKGKKIACGPGIQNVTMAKIILEKNGFTAPQVMELPVGQHAPALAAGQVDGVYTLEPTGTVGRMKGLARVLETGVISRYVLGDAAAPWFGGAAALTSSFISSENAQATAFIAAYGKAVEFIQQNPDAARENVAGYTSIEPALVKEVPLPGFVMYDQLTGNNLQWFQKFYDVFSERKIFRQPVDVAKIIYHA
ncbi:NitT/TauT family transport system substrate-binding protein [Erwinia toletana]|uniref:NitT/TauT family transport system substrate-binding protein n=1 Tax=Winslowiella toletana TaxID=92490 RepID=A0ABS4P653_9GAMM|nr:ABC transporter substrate-binding protein [Winslowiella toletana]MBP2167590.1 NitT/TauT family transport system substrate-binding protein [Winslowiella toletana]